MDIKCPSSGEDQKMNFTNFELLGSGDQVKFVIVNDEDYQHAKQVIEDHLKSVDFDIVFTPCDMPDAFELKSLSERVLKDGLNVRVLPQLHKLIWPEKPRGV
jgi:7-carboxy-7-deazaguanine synthase